MMGPPGPRSSLLGGIMPRSKRPDPAQLQLAVNSEELAVIVDALIAHRDKIPSRGRGPRPRGWIDFDDLLLRLVIAQRDAKG